MLIYIWVNHREFLYLSSLMAQHRGRVVDITLSDKIWVDKIFRRKKFFGGQNFRQQARLSALLSTEILSDKVCEIVRKSAIIGNAP